LHRLPGFLQPRPEKRALVLGLDAQGRVVHNLQYAGADAYAPVTSVREHDGWLYLGSLTERGVGRIRAPSTLAGAQR
jgi:strictosidine synthase